jgi:hypothetical protein
VTRTRSGISVDEFVPGTIATYVIVAGTCRTVVDVRGIAEVEGLSAKTRRLDGDVEPIVEAGRTAPVELGVHQHDVEFVDPELRAESE